jgi:hypothetical protein
MMCTNTVCRSETGWYEPQQALANPVATAWLASAPRMLLSVPRTFVRLRA